MKKRRLKKEIIYYFFGFVVLIVSIIILVSHNKLVNSDEYKLEQLGYNETEIELIIEKNYVDFALENYKEGLIQFIDKKYFIRKNLDKYLSYYKDNKTVSIEKIISVINVGANNEYYANAKLTSSNDLLVLVNKFNGLESTYAPNDLVNMSLMYAYSNNKIRSEVNTKYTEMAAVAKTEGFTLIASYSYRSYQEQESAYNKYYDSKGLAYADSFAARAGFSEHQTGLALDITTRLEDDEEFVETEEFSWLQENAHNYGFILRYPKDMEDITGYTYEPWHYRYVGVDVATKIYNEGITFDEYYAYYIEENAN